MASNGEHRATTKPPPTPSPLRFSKFFQVKAVVSGFITAHHLDWSSFCSKDICPSCLSSSEDDFLIILSRVLIEFFWICHLQHVLLKIMMQDT